MHPNRSLIDRETSMPQRDAAANWLTADCTAPRAAAWAIDQIVLDMAAEGFDARDCRAMRLELARALAAAERSAKDLRRPRPRLRYLVRPERAMAAFQDPDRDDTASVKPGSNDATATEFSLAALEREFRRGQATMGRYATWVRFDRDGACRALCRYRSERN
jgi:hypothetical protein